MVSGGLTGLPELKWTVKLEVKTGSKAGVTEPGWETFVMVEPSDVKLVARLLLLMA